MPVSQEEVNWAYRMFLGREAIEDAAAAGHLDQPDRNALRHAFIQSAEFKAIGGRGDDGLVGRFQDIGTLSVEIDCSPEQRAVMIAHIASEWRKYGNEAPHWSVLTGEEFKPEHIAQNIEAFYASGRDHAAVMLNPLRRAGVNINPFRRVMDFGCGVGRLTLALAPIVERIIGVDISPPHLALARERAGVSSNATFLSIDTIDDIAGLGIFDLIVSFIVLQHNPPPIMAEILHKLLACLAPGGCIVLQVPTYIEGYAFRTQDYAANPNAGINAHPLPQHAIFKAFATAGCDVLEVREDNFLGGPSLSHTFAAQKR